MKHIADDNVLYVLQYLTVNLVGKGYVRHGYCLLPEKKRDRWADIVQKVNGRYVTKRGQSVFDLSRDQRARRKQMGLLNAIMVWWRCHLFIFATNGKDDVGLTGGEQLHTWPKVGPIIPAGKNFIYTIVRSSEGATLALTRGCFQDKLAYFEGLAQRAPLAWVQKEFALDDRLIPGYAGCNRQKKAIAKAIITSARRNGRQEFTKELFPITMRRPTVAADGDN